MKEFRGPCRFWNKVERDDPEGCWLWSAARDRTGYGVYWSEGRLVRAHRHAYELRHGTIPEGLELHHVCVVRRCVNPAHLVATTRAEHPDSGPAIAASRSTCPHGHHLDGSRRKRNPDGSWRTFRECLTCKRAHDRARYLRRLGALA